MTRDMRVGGLFLLILAVLLPGGGISCWWSGASTPVPTFNKARGLSGAVYSIAPATDGSGDVYAGGEFVSYNSTRSDRIIRFNSDETVDTGFAIGTGFNAAVRAIAPAGDGTGDVYVGGDFTSYGSTGVNRIVRLNSDGTIDPGFAIGTGFNGLVFAIAPAGDGTGDVYVGGAFTSYNGTGANYIIRLNSDGTIDPGFAIGTGFNNWVNAIAPAGDGTGDVYVGGYFTSYNGTAANHIIRLNSDGTIDPGFAIGTGFDNTVLVIAPAGDGTGDLYVGGSFTSYNGTAANYIIRLNSDGTIDPGFAIGSGFNSLVGAIAPAGDGTGDVYVGGYFTSYNGSTGKNYIIRLNSNGTIDTGFATGTGFNGQVFAIAPAGDGTGDLYVGGSFTSYNGTAANYIIRLNSNGTIDTGFDIGAGFDSAVFAIAPAGDGTGDVYVGGNFTSYNGTAANRIIRLNSDGTIDTGFAIGSGFNGLVGAIVSAGDGTGDVYVGGAFTQYDTTMGVNRIVRLDSTGAIDPGLDIGTGFNGQVNAIAPARDGTGDVYVGGNFTSYNGTGANYIIRLNSDGTIDPGFAIETGFNAGVRAIAPAGDGTGRMYVGGGFTTYKSTTVDHIARLKPDGSLD